MSHYDWRDFNPAAAEAEDRRVEAQDKLLAQLNNIPVRKLAVGDILRLIDIVRPTYDTLTMSEDDIKIVKKIMQKAKNA
jgi:hypothetical protein